MAWASRGIAPDAETTPWAIGGLGIAFLVAFFAEAAFFGGLDPAVLLSAPVLAAFVVHFPFVAGIVYGGYWLANSSVSPERYLRAAKWCIGGAAVFIGLNALLIVFFTPETRWLIVGWLRGTATMGAAGGLLAGLTEARAIHNAVEAERKSMRASYLENQREALDYLNGLLRHEVLNTAQVINGYTSVLLDDDHTDPERRFQLEAIRRQSKGMTTVVEDVRLLIEATRDEALLRPVDLSTVVREELQDLRDTAAVVEIDADVPDDVTVSADTLVRRVFSNLFDNAVEHHDGDGPHVEVTVETTAERAIVRISDDGPGVPEDRREGLFERDDLTHSDQGLGLYLVARLMDRYGGHVELTETGPSGSTFTVELPRAETGDGESPDSPVVGGAGDATGSTDRPRDGTGERPSRGVADARSDGSAGG